MADPARRGRRLREGFPALYDTTPGDSALGVLLDALAAALTALDADTERVVRDRWPRLAGRAPSSAQTVLDLLEQAEQGDPGAPAALDALRPALQAARAPLEALGRLVGVVALPDEPLELFRARLLTQARVLREGVTSPAALLRLSAAALGTSPCPRLWVEEPPPQPGWVGGWRAVQAIGLPPGAPERCGPGCGTLEVCRLESQRLCDLSLVENPPTEQVRTLSGLRPQQRAIPLDNPSLTDAEPALRLTALEPVDWPSIQHEDDVFFYADTLDAGQTLVVVPGDPPQAWLERDGAIEADARDSVVTYSTSARFADDSGASVTGSEAARFATSDTDGARFARFDQARLRTPRVPAGGGTWTLDRMGLRRLNELLTEAVRRERFPGALLAPRAGRLDIEVRWMAHPPLSVLLRVPRTRHVERMLRLGVARLLTETLELARAAGVQAALDMPSARAWAEEPLGGGDALRSAVRARFAERQGASERLELALSAAFGESHGADDQELPLPQGGLITPLFVGVFADDTLARGTRFDGSRFAPEPV